MKFCDLGTNLGNLGLAVFANFINLANLVNLVLAIFVNLANLANLVLTVLLYFTMFYYILIYLLVRKTAVCNGDQLLDFSVLELVRSQSTFSPDLEVLQHCACFTLCSSAGPAVCDCAAMLGFTQYTSVQIYCVLCVLKYYMLNSQL